MSGIETVWLGTIEVLNFRLNEATKKQLRVWSELSVEGGDLAGRLAGDGIVFLFCS